MQAVIPEPLVERDPVPNRAESLGDEVVSPLAAVSLLGHQAGIEQNAEVLRDGRAAHLEVPGNRVDRVVGLRKQIKNPPPRGVADRGEDIGLPAEGFHLARSIGKEVLTCQDWGKLVNARGIGLSLELNAADQTSATSGLAARSRSVSMDSRTSRAICVFGKSRMIASPIRSASAQL